MSDARLRALYRPPDAQIEDLVQSSYPVEGTGSVSVGRCISDAFASGLRNWASALGLLLLMVPLGFGMLVMSSFVYGLATVLSDSVAYVALYASFVLHFAVTIWGVHRFALNAIDGRAFPLDLLAGFGRMGTVAVRLAILLVVLGALQLPVVWGIAAMAYPERIDVENVVLRYVGAALALLWLLFVLPRFYLTIFYVLEHDRGVPSSLLAAWRHTRTSWIELGLLMGLSWMMLAIGTLLAVLPVIPAAFLTLLLWASAYRQLTATPRA